MEQYDYNAYYLCPDEITSRFFTELMYAVTHELFDIIKASDHWFAPDKINFLNEEGWSTLMLAAISDAKAGMNNIVRLLLQRGADVNLQDSSGWSALALAAQSSCSISSVEIVKILLENGANPNLKVDYESILSLSIYDNNDKNVEATKLVLDYGADINMIHRIKHL